MTNLVSIATAALNPGQLLDTDQVRFHRVDYIELQRLLDVETLEAGSLAQAVIAFRCEGIRDYIVDGERAYW